MKCKMVSEICNSGLHIEENEMSANEFNLTHLYDTSDDFLDIKAEADLIGFLTLDQVV
jgi:hypothetical protein